MSCGNEKADLRVPRLFTVSGSSFRFAFQASSIPLFESADPVELENEFQTFCFELRSEQDKTKSLQREKNSWILTALPNSKLEGKDELQNT